MLSKFFNVFRPQKWDPIRQEGNPTKSNEVNELITIMKRDEVRGLGIPSKARRPISMQEFRQMVAYQRSNAKTIEDYSYVALWLLQWHMIGRVDDMCKLNISSIEPNINFSGFLSLILTWSKNVRDERNCPAQIVMSAMISELCPIIALGVYWAKLIQDYSHLTEEQFKNIFAAAPQFFRAKLGGGRLSPENIRTRISQMCSMFSYIFPSQVLMG